MGHGWSVQDARDAGLCDRFKGKLPVPVLSYIVSFANVREHLGVLTRVSTTWLEASRQPSSWNSTHADVDSGEREFRHPSYETTRTLIEKYSFRARHVSSSSYLLSLTNAVLAFPGQHKHVLSVHWPYGFIGLTFDNATDVVITSNMCKDISKNFPAAERLTVEYPDWISLGDSFRVLKTVGSRVNELTLRMSSVFGEIDASRVTAIKTLQRMHLCTADATPGALQAVAGVLASVDRLRLSPSRVSVLGECKQLTSVKGLCLYSSEFDAILESKLPLDALTIGIGLLEVMQNAETNERVLNRLADFNRRFPRCRMAILVSCSDLVQNYSIRGPQGQKMRPEYEVLMRHRVSDWIRDCADQFENAVKSRIPGIKVSCK